MINQKGPVCSRTFFFAGGFMADLTQDSKISFGLLIALLALCFSFWGYSRDVEAQIATERSERQALEVRVDWMEKQADQQAKQINSIDKNVRDNGKALARILAIAEKEAKS